MTPNTEALHQTKTTTKKKVGIKTITSLQCRPIQEQQKNRRCPWPRFAPLSPATAQPHGRDPLVTHNAKAWNHTTRKEKKVGTSLLCGQSKTKTRKNDRRWSWPRFAPLSSAEAQPPCREQSLTHNAVA